MPYFLFIFITLFIRVAEHDYNKTPLLLLNISFFNINASRDIPTLRPSSSLNNILFFFNTTFPSSPSKSIPRPLLRIKTHSSDTILFVFLR